MRPIKFRAFHKKIKVIKQVCNINFNHEEIVVYQGEGMFNEIWFSPDFELMQFTGLHDSTGKEIYEGDILRIDLFEEEKRGIFQIYFKEGEYVICNHHGEFSLKFMIKGNRPYCNKLEVIGSIHENPELLESNR